MKLPIGISTFSKIREDNYIYIDKTELALRIINNHSYVFLSRPRRFGKSLMLDTLKEIFEGNRELFEGLYIHDRYDFERYPVIKISFGGNLRSIESITERIKVILERCAKSLGVDCGHGNVDNMFEALIREAHEKYDKKVVVLIDEYDKPILDNIDNREMALNAREFLKGFYTILKENDACLRFVFLTGVSKFARVSIFSGLNNLDDISLDRPYAVICGYTQADIETTFAPLLKGVDMEKFRAWYNGYNFNGENVYNPFDVLLFISKEHTYNSYWFSTATPTFLVKLLSEQEFFAPELEHLVSNQSLVDSFDIEKLRIEPILFQSGYLTLDSIEETPFGGLEYRLRIPNKEVQISFNDMIMELLSDFSFKLENKNRLYLSLSAGDMDALKQNLHALYAGIPYTHFTNNNICRYEGYYASVFYACIASLGLKIIPEDITNRGRIDFTVFIEDKCYIFEFKVMDENPLKQVREKKYFEKYMDSGKEIIIAGITFDEEKRNISSMEWEKIPLS